MRYIHERRHRREVPLNIQDFTWSTNVTFKVGAYRKVNENGSLYQDFKIRVIVRMSLDSARFDFTINFKDYVRMQDVSIYENGKQRVLVGQIPLQDLWSTHHNYDIYSQFYICHTNHNHDWGFAGISTADQKIYLYVAPPFGASGTN